LRGWILCPCEKYCRVLRCKVLHLVRSYFSPTAARFFRRVAALAFAAHDLRVMRTRKALRDSKKSDNKAGVFAFSCRLHDDAKASVGSFKIVFWCQSRCRWLGTSRNKQFLGKRLGKAQIGKRQEPQGKNSHQTCNSRDSLIFLPRGQKGNPQVFCLLNNKTFGKGEQASPSSHFFGSQLCISTSCRILNSTKNIVFSSQICYNCL